MNKHFLKAINDIKKQKSIKSTKEVIEKVKQVIDDQQISSNEEKRLKQLGVLKKKIHKEERTASNQWKHDKFLKRQEKGRF